MLLGFALLATGLLLLGGCTGGLTGSAKDPIVGKWTFQGTAPKTGDPASAKYELPAGASVQTQEFLADGKYINPRGESRTWKRVDANTVEMAKVRVIVTIKGNDLYETLSARTQHWTKTK
jgi:hypothetical protein